ncbi:MAG TPA: ROK family protein [Bryobacteraceae bacterium]|nr:ROK family protein [Bryobacteraceae bacterium]
MPVYGGIECGGTKFVCATGDESGQLLARTEFPTTLPDETIGRAMAFFREQPHELTSIGIGSFGPVDLNRASPRFGYVTSTPKNGWRDTDVAGAVRRATGLPVAFDTDVNTAALGEFRWGAARGLDTFIYLTIGTGLGGGGMVNGRLLHGLVHPEMGHIRVPHDRTADPFPGNCPFHGDCLEGLVAGPAVEARWGGRGETLPAGHPAWDLEAHYIALGLATWICTLSPERIILGGGVMRQAPLFGKIHDEVLTLLNDYIQAPEILECIHQYIVPPALGGNAGVLGAIALATMV